MSSKYYKYGNRGLYYLQFKVIQKDGNLEIDYFLITDDYSKHGRINKLGENEFLGNYKGQFGWPILENEEETKKEHSVLENIMKWLVNN